MLPDINSLRITDGDTPSACSSGIPIPNDIEDAQGEYYMEKLKAYAKSLPYSIEPNSKMIDMLDFILTRLVQIVEAKDFDVGFLQWDSMLT